VTLGLTPCVVVGKDPNKGLVYAKLQKGRGCKLGLKIPHGVLTLHRSCSKDGLLL
jgi:hypothetical protein